jgi:serpin B
MRYLHVIALGVALTLIAAACGDATETAPSTAATSSTTGPPDSIPTTVPFVNGEEIRLDLPRATVEVSEADLASVVGGDNQFGLDLFAAVATDGNVMLSPYSIATALSMLYPGARGATAEEIAAVLHLTVDDATLHAVRNQLDAALSAAPLPQGEEDTRQPFAIRPANSAWGQGGYSFLDSYLEVLATDYGAGLRLTDFAGDPAGATNTINEWVEQTTEDRIQDLIPPGAIDALTRLVLVNAIWFKANWAAPFEAELTAPDDFTLLDGSTVSVPLMHSSQRTAYARTNLYEAVRLPYAGNAAMVVMLPTQGTPADLAAVLGREDMNPAWIDAQVDITLPSFEFDSEISLKEALMALGMETAFHDPSAPDGADLTGITALRELFVADALHKSFIALDEEGTEAAAATALIIGITSLPQPATFTVDRPFLFWIEHTTTGEVLFLGQVTNPVA